MRILNTSTLVLLAGLTVASSVASADHRRVGGARWVRHVPHRVWAQKPRMHVHPPRVSVAQRITANPQLVSAVQPLLPAGTTLEAAAQGFRTQGQFLAALHASQNLNVPFADLKAKILADHGHLSQAIHELQPTVDAKAAAKLARTEAMADLKSTGAAPPWALTVAQRVTANPQLVSALQPLLPAGSTLGAAAEGFRTQGQFIAALHVSQNLNIPFADLKAQIVAGHHHLGRAILALQPTADAKAAVKLAFEQTKADFEASGVEGARFARRGDHVDKDGNR